MSKYTGAIGAAILFGFSSLCAAAPTQIKHVFTIILENEDYGNSFGPGSPAMYLAQTLTAQGAHLESYYGIGHVSLDNYIAMISGQRPNPMTQADCQVFQQFIGLPPSQPSGQSIGEGCVYLQKTQTLPRQLTDRGLSWKGYMEDMGNDLARDGRATCSHPGINKQDMTQAATAADSYATRHNPFVYFHSIINDQAYCDARVVRLDRLPADLATVATTPNYVFITPSLCHDGHDAPCANGEPGGLVSADAFLRVWVPRIVNSPAFQADGLLIITFDESSGPQSDSSGCCNGALRTANLPGITGPGGGRVGAVLLSPFIAPGTTTSVPYNHYSMLRTVEDIFGLPYLGDASDPHLTSFGRDVFSAIQPVFPPKH
jgi:hypothetical protein